MSRLLPPPPLHWEGPTPVHRDFADGYYSRDDGAAEAEYVFLAHNQLPDRWTRARRFTLGELGFGTGLNFFLSWALWQRCAPTTAVLDYVSFEAQPMAAADRRRALARWPQLAPLVAAFEAQNPGPVPGFHQLHFPGLRLLLIQGDARQMLPQLTAQVDAWFLDGFAPGGNPQMWEPALLRAAAAASRRGASFATYSAAGVVQRALRQAGFAVHKDKGFGRKREMLFGALATPPESSRPPWFGYPPAQAGPVEIIGGGLAGACTARALAESGRPVRLYTGTGGTSTRIPAMLVRPYPENADSPASRLYATAATAALRDYVRWCPAAFTPQEIVRQAGTALCGGVLASPRALAAITAHPHIERIPADTTMTRNGLRVFCCGELPPDAALGAALQPVAGQCLSLSGAPATSPRLGQLQWIPQANGALLGSSYRPGRRSLAPDERETATLLATAQANWPELAPARLRSIHTGLRFSSPDHLPLLGPWPDPNRWRQDYAGLHHGRPAASYPAAALLSGRWLNLAHGSRGATLSPLAGRLLAAALDGAPLPLPTDLLAAVHPGRFLVRELRRAPAHWDR